MIAVIDLPRRIDPELAADIEKEVGLRVAVPWAALRVTGGARRGRARDRRSHPRRRGPGPRSNASSTRCSSARTASSPRSSSRPSATTTGRSRPGCTRSCCAAAGCSTMAAGTSPWPARRWRWPELIDAKAAELYVQHFRAEPRSFPAFVDAEILHRCGYFDSHPNAVSFVGHMVEDFDAIEAFRQANSCAEGALMPARRTRSSAGPVPQPRRLLPLLSDARRAGGSARRAPPSPGRAGCSATSRATSSGSTASGSSTSASWCSSAATSTSPTAAGASCR